MRVTLLTRILVVLGLAFFIGACEREAPEYSRKGGVDTPPVAQRESALPTDASEAKIREAQQALKERGHDPGNINGLMNEETRDALRQFQRAQGLEVTGQLDQRTMTALGV